MCVLDRPKETGYAGLQRRRESLETALFSARFAMCLLTVFGCTCYEHSKTTGPTESAIAAYDCHAVDTIVLEIRLGLLCQSRDVLNSNNGGPRC